MTYWRAIPQTDGHRPKGAERLAGGWTWVSHVERIERGGARTLVPLHETPSAVIERLTACRASVSGLSMDTPRLMGILNVTPDSFSDGGLFNAPDAALAQARAMVAEGADILDIGGESTRPGAAFVDEADEIARTAPVIAAIRAADTTPISIDTRKAPVAQAALTAGADVVNDVAAFTFDPAMAEVTAAAGAPCCLMHAQGDPATMQDDPTYEDVVLDVYDFLEARVAVAEAAGIRRDQIIVDPGIGFGKTLDHNLVLLKNLSIFHSLGCAILLGASRKRFIGTLGAAPEARDRAPGSIAVALHGVRQGVQILRVHDTKETRQALSLHMAVS
ncbi:dihydropteroate synthase [Pseudooctadecabacter jejudonensis]|uniref:Dihydropteroate synthase n=1 Tax=Pseudooctadecabacter jejudonensis TaxID=1391910 RepID=A0A1Y5RNR0_9RHOB|nr:dihydropteroate synthase [Pseudooctadecabacter jejudonensis]SLN21927.1 Dihydropteroate synthase [Pseudooctadecabacter jejudonensis]